MEIRTRHSTITCSCCKGSGRASQTEKIVLLNPNEQLVYSCLLRSEGLNLKISTVAKRTKLTPKQVETAAKELSESRSGVNFSPIVWDKQSQTLRKPDYGQLTS